MAGLAEAIASLPYKITKVPLCVVTPDGIPASVVYPVLQVEIIKSQTCIKLTTRIDDGAYFGEFMAAITLGSADVRTAGTLS